MTLFLRVGKAAFFHRGSVAESLLLASCIPALFVPASAADFSNAQKIYVPPSSYERRVDFSSIREQNSLEPVSTVSKNAPPPAKKTAGTPVKVSNKNSKTGYSPAASKAASKTVKTATAKTARKTIIKEGSPPAPALKADGLSANFAPELARSLGIRISPATLAKMKETAAELQKSGKLEEAHQMLSRISQLNPQDKAALKQASMVALQKAKNYLNSSNYHEALLSARQALAASPGNSEAEQVLGQLYKKVGADPNDVGSRLKTADSLMQQSRYQEAEVEYKASLAVKPTQDAYVGLGRISEKIHGAGSGKDYFEKALELDSNSATAHKELGSLYLRKGDLVGANSELSRTLILSPSDREASESLIKLWQEQVLRVPGANSHLGLARAYQLSGDLPEAQSEYREVVRLDPNNPYLPAARQSFKIALAKQEADKSMGLARSLEGQGLLAEAYSKASEAVQYSPGNSAYRIYQGDLLQKLGHPAEARQVYMNLLKDDPQNAQALQKIKEISSYAPVGLSAGAPQSMPVAASTHPAGFPGSKFPVEMTADSAALSGVTGLAAAAGSSALNAGAAPTVDHVASLSSFVGQLRNHMLVSKDANQQLEDSAHKILKQAISPDSSSGSPADQGASDDDIIKKILSSPSPSADSATAASQSGADAALAGAAAALSAVKAGKPSPAAPQSAKTASKSLSSASASAPKQSTEKRLQELEKQNKELQDKIRALSAGQTETSRSLQSAAAAPLPAQTFNNPEASAAGNSYLPAMTAMAAPAALYSVGAFSGTSPYNQGGNTLPQASPELRTAIPVESPMLRFELRKIKPSLKDLQLEVSLNNGGGAPVAIPSNVEAFIRYADSKESPLKVAFDGKTVPARGTLAGIVKVPFSKVDPSADLVLRNLVPSGDLHLNKSAITQNPDITR